MDWLVGHLVGDYIFQTDWQAQNKTWAARKWQGLAIALYHAALWTFAIWMCGAIWHQAWNGGWKPQALILMWALHGLQDWTRFPSKLMEYRKQFVHFKQHMPQAYVWACIIVDNTIHLFMLLVLAAVWGSK